MAISALSKSGPKGKKDFYTQRYHKQNENYSGELETKDDNFNPNNKIINCSNGNGIINLAGGRKSNSNQNGFLAAARMGPPEIVFGF